MYDGYIRTLNQIQDKNSPFKRDAQYIGILEHVSREFGEQYLRLLYSEFSMTKETVHGFCDINDSFGSPNTCLIGDLDRPVSPTSLRYLYHASLILKYANGASSFVEVGGGYGGLCLAMFYLSKTPIQEYHLVDLDPAIRLQRMVLSENPNVFYHSSDTFGKDVPNGCFFISNYCFSEISDSFQKKYIEHLVSRCTHGFLAWNTIPCYSMGKQIVVETERPLTYSNNYFVYF